MNIYLKKALLVGCVFLVTFISGCSTSEEKESPTPKEEQVVTNSVYEAPTSMTPEQIIQYNALSNALNGTDDAKIAELVAINYAYQFYTLANKSGKDDVGGLMYLPEESREEFKNYAMYKYYTNYQTVVSQYGKESLPNVIMHETKRVEASQLYYANQPFDGYIVDLTLKYADSKLSENALKAEISVQVINNNGVYQVIAAEDPTATGNNK